MKAKTLFDLKYGYYRDMLNKPAIPLEARQFIFDCMEAYAAQEVKNSTIPIVVGQSKQYCECVPPYSDADNECCIKCQKLLPED